DHVREGPRHPRRVGASPRVPPAGRGIGHADADGARAPRPRLRRLGGQDGDAGPLHASVHAGGDRGHPEAPRRDGNHHGREAMSVATLGWTLLHFLWQGTLVAAALAVANAIL